jgi:hypothetical protein
MLEWYRVRNGPRSNQAKSLTRTDISCRVEVIGRTRIRRDASSASGTIAAIIITLETSFTNCLLTNVPIILVGVTGAACVVTATFQ